MLTTADGPSSGRGDRARAGRGGKAHRKWRKWQQLGLSESEKVAMVGGGEWKKEAVAVWLGVAGAPMTPYRATAVGDRAVVGDGGWGMETPSAGMKMGELTPMGLHRTVEDDSSKGDGGRWS
jgi:hypothetical protein